MKTFRFLIAVMVMSAGFFDLNAQTLIIRTQAGDDTAGFTGTAPLAMKARITQSSGVAVDSRGNLYFTNDSLHVIQKVTPNGNLTIYAGIPGSHGLSGDGGPATAAQLFNPLGMACDANGNLYFADNENYCVRKIDTFGIITKVAGVGGVFGFGSSGDGHHADSALTGAYNIALDRYGNLYIADGSQRVRRVDTNGIITTVVGSGAYGTTVVNGIPATAAAFSSITGVAVDTSGDIFVSDIGTNTVRVVRPNDTIYAFAGTGVAGSTGDNGIATAAKLNGPVSLALDAAGNLYIADRGNNKIRRVTPADTIKTVAGTGTAGFSGEGGAPTSAALKAPNAVCFNAAGNMFISDAGNYCIRGVMPPDSIAITSSKGNVRDTVCKGYPVTFTATVKHPGYGDSVRWTKNSVQVAGNLLSVTLDSFNNNDTVKCLLYAPGGGTVNLTSNKILITVLPTPQAITGGTAQVCVGDSIALSDTGAGVWSLSSSLLLALSSTHTVTGLAAGVDSVVYINAKGCSAFYPVTVNPNPSPIGGSSSAVCADSGLALSESDAFGLWSSSMVVVASVDFSGNVTAVSPGAATISYTFPTGCFAVYTVTVNPNPTPISGTAVICAGDSTALADTGAGLWTVSNPALLSFSSAHYATGLEAGTDTVVYTSVLNCKTFIPVTINPNPSPIVGSISAVCANGSISLTDTSLAGHWISSSPMVVTVDTMGTLTAIGAGVATVSYSYSTGCYAKYQVTVNPNPTVISGITVVCAGDSSKLSDDLLGGAWTVRHGLVSVSDSGVLYGLSSGTDTITYTLPTGCYTSIASTVKQVPSAINNYATSVTALCTGTSVNLFDTVTGGFWSSSDTTIAIINSAAKLTGIRNDTALVKYTLPDGCFAKLMVIVDSVPAPITGSNRVCVGSTVTLSNIASGGVWYSTDTNASIADSTMGLVAGLAPGIDTVVFEIGTGCITRFPLNVNALPAAIAGPDSVCKGSSVTLTDASVGGSWSSTDVGAISVTALGVASCFSSTSIVYALPTGCNVAHPIFVKQTPSALATGTAICVGDSRSLSDSVVGGIWYAANSLGTVDSLTGLFHGLASGTDTIFYMLPSLCGVSAPIVVNAPPAAIGGVTSLCQGDSTVLNDSTAGGIWISTDTSVISVSSSGTVSCISSGSANIKYALPTGCSVVATVSVNALPLPILGGDSVCVGVSKILFDSSHGGVWTTSSFSVMTIDSAGVVVGLASGLDTVFYTNPTTGCHSWAPFTVNPAPAPVFGDSSICPAGQTTFGSATGLGLWSSNDSLILMKVDSGTFVGVAGGIASVTYTLPTGCMAYKAVTVNRSPAAISGTTAICVGSSNTLSDSSLGGLWVSNDTSLAVVSVSGLVTGIRQGIDTVKYVFSATGCGVSKAITVNPLPAPILGLDSICNGAIASFTDSADGGTWTTSDTLLAPITTSGMLTARAVGNIYLLYSLPTGCAAVKAVAIDSTPQPVLGASTICNGSLQILVDSTQGGHWLSSNQSVAKINAAGYFVTQGPGFDTASYVLPNGCSSFLFVSVIPSPSAIDGNLNLCVGSVGTLTDSTGGGSWVSSNPAGVSISAAGVVSAMFQSVDTITYTANGCSTSAVVNVYPLPFTPVITLETPPSLCNGTMYQNFGTNSPVPDVQYSWSATGAQVWAQGSGHQYCLVNFENPGAAVVTLSTNYIGYSCYSSSSYTVSVSNTLSETVGLAYFENNFYCLNNDVSSYQWGYDVASTLQPVVLTGETNQNYYNPLPDLANKYYWVEVVSPDGCTQKTYWNTPLGIINQNPVATAGMLLYPNPTEDGSFRVEIPGAEGTAQVVVTDVLGNTVFNGIESLYNHQCPVVLKGAAAGVYMVKADAGDREYTSRIVVK